MLSGRQGFGPASIGLAVTIALASGAASPADADAWARVSTPGTIGAVACPRVSGPGVLLSTQMGMTRSIDGGQTWTDASTGLARETWNGRPEQIVVAAATETGLVAVASSGAIYRSADKGASWTGVAPPVPGWGAAAMATVHLAVEPGRVHLALGGGHWDSVDDGRTWRQNVNRFPWYPISLLARQGRLISTGEHGILAVSTDDGAHWQRPRRGLPKDVSQFTTLAEDGGHLYVGTAGEGLFQSRDGGDSWRPIPLDGGGQAPSIGELLFIGTSLYVSTDRGIFRSARRGPWPRIHDPLPCPMVASADALISSADDRTLRSVDQGVTWTPIGTGYRNDAVEKLAASDSVVVVRAFSAGPAFISSDGGRTFTSPPAARLVGAAVSGPMILLAAAEPGRISWQDGAGYLLRSPDAGRTWTRLPLPSGATISRAYPLVIDGQSVLIASDGLALSTDAGGTWTRIVDGFPAPYRGWSSTGAAQFAVAAGRNLVLGGEDGLFVRPRTGGPWKSAPPPLPPGVRFPAPQAVTAVVRGDAVYAIAFGRLYRSDDDGESWTDLTGGVPIDSHKTLIELVAAHGRRVLIATGGERRALLLSDDRGASWRRVDDGLPPNRVSGLAAIDAGFLAGTVGAGIWRHK